MDFCVIWHPKAYIWLIWNVGITSPRVELSVFMYIYAVLWHHDPRLLDSYPPDARHRFSTIVSWLPDASLCFIWNFVPASDSRRRDARPLPLWCRRVSRGSSSLHWESFVGVGKTCVSTVGVVLPASCRVASLCSSSLYSESYVGVATFGIGFLVSGWLSLGTFGDVSCSVRLCWPWFWLDCFRFWVRLLLCRVG
jgi:hypothetical protein